MKRTDERETAFMMLFEKSFSPDCDIDELMTLACENMEFSVTDYCRKLVYGVIAEKGHIDGIIDRFSEKWKSNRLSRVALVAAEIAVFEILNSEDVPAAAAVNEAIELIKKYDTEESAKYVNGVLGGFIRSEIND